MHLLPTYSLWVQHCFHAHAVHYDGIACREAAAIREGMCATTLKLSQQGEREYRWGVHQQRVRLIRQQESNDGHSQSLGLVKRSAEQRKSTLRGLLHEIPCNMYTHTLHNIFFPPCNLIYKHKLWGKGGGGSLRIRLSLELRMCTDSTLLVHVLTDSQEMLAIVSFVIPTVTLKGMSA